MSSSGGNSGPKSMKAKWKLTQRDKVGKGIISKPISRPVAKAKTLEDLYNVEKIIKKKYDEGIIKYLIKWDGYPSSSNTWEPRAHIPAHMVTEFENEILSKESGSPSPVSEDLSGADSQTVIHSKDDSGITIGYIDDKDNNNQIHTILFAQDLENKTLSSIETVTYKPLKNDPSRKPRLTFIVRFEGSNKPEAVTSADARVFFPEKVIEYFESIITFS